MWIILAAIVIASVALPVYAAKPPKPTSTLELVQVRLIANGQTIVLSPSQLVALPAGTSFNVEADVKNISTKTINVRVQFYFTAIQTLYSDIVPGATNTFTSDTFSVAYGYNTLTVTATNTVTGDSKLQTNTIYGS